MKPLVICDLPEGVLKKMIQRDKIIAENFVKIRNIRENFSKSSDFICLFAKISVSLQFIEVSITKRRNNMRAMRIADDVTSVKK